LIAKFAVNYSVGVDLWKFAAMFFG